MAGPAHTAAAGGRVIELRVSLRRESTEPAEPFDLAADLVLPSRGVTVLFGPSGCGKTSALRVIAGLEAGARGRVALDGEVWQDDAARVFISPHQRPIGMVFQEPRLFPHLSVQANIEYGLRRLPAAERRIRPNDVAALLGIEPLMARRPASLSGGEAQRVAMARALCTSPKLLLMDEPLAALDEARKDEVLPYLERLKRELGMPIVYVTHSPRERARLADHLVLLDAGRVLQSGTIEALSAMPSGPMAAQDDAAVVLDAQVIGHDAAVQITQLAIDGGTLWSTQPALAPGRSVRMQIHARDVSVALQPPAHTSIVNQLGARIVSCNDDGQGRCLLVLQVGERTQLLARLTRKSVLELKLAPGLAVTAMVKGVAVLDR
jgi:molybdate transport system ATP-binding protein